MTEHNPATPHAVSVYGATAIAYPVGRKAFPYAKPWPCLIYVLSGSATYKLNNITYPVHPGDCFLIPPNVTAGVLPITDGPFVARQIKLDVHDPKLLNQLGQICSPLATDATLLAMLNYVFQFWNYRAPLNKLRVESFLYAILSLFSVHNSRSFEYIEADPAFVLVDGYSPATIKALHFVEANPYRSFSLDDMSRELGYNKSYLCSAVSTDTGFSIVDYINFHKARLGCVYMFFWGTSIAETSTRLHFTYQDYFRRIFRKFVGIPPSIFFKACSFLTADERTQIVASEPILSYHALPIDDLFAALRHLGETMMEILKRKTQQLPSNDSDLSES